MGRYKIHESVGTKLQPVHSYEDLEIHHPSKRGHEPGRLYGTFDGEREEILRSRTSANNRMVSKDFILTDSETKTAKVAVPSPVSGYIGKVDTRNGLVTIHDCESHELLAQVRHMDLRGTGLNEGQRVEYGQPLGMQGGYGGGNPHRFGTHVHIDFNEQHLDKLKQYIRDIDTGLIMSDASLGKGKVRVTASAVQTARLASRPDGVLEQGEQGTEIKHLQQTLTHLGYRDPQGRPLKTDGDFGERTKQAVQAFQRAHDLEPDGIAGPKTQAALRAAERQLLTHAQHPHHGLFRNAMEKVHGAEFQRHIAPGPHSERLAASLTVEALREGLTRIDRVEFNDRGTLARAVQVHPLRDEPGLNRSTDGVGTQQASTQSILQSSQQAQRMAHEAQQPQRMAHEAQQPQAEMQRAQLRSAALP